MDVPAVPVEVVTADGTVYKREQGRSEFVKQTTPPFGPEWPPFGPEWKCSNPPPRWIQRVCVMKPGQSRVQQSCQARRPDGGWLCGNCGVGVFPPQPAHGEACPNPKCGALVSEIY